MTRTGFWPRFEQRRHAGVWFAEWHGFRLCAAGVMLVAAGMMHLRMFQTHPIQRHRRMLSHSSITSLGDTCTFSQHLNKASVLHSRAIPRRAPVDFSQRYLVNRVIEKRIFMTMPCFDHTAEAGNALTQPVPCCLEAVRCTHESLHPHRPSVKLASAESQTCLAQVPYTLRLSIQPCAAQALANICKAITTTPA